MKFDTVKSDNILMLDLLEELNLLGDRLKGTRVFLLDRNLRNGAGTMVEGRRNEQHHLFVLANLFDSIDFTGIQVEALVNLPKPTFTCMHSMVQVDTHTCSIILYYHAINYQDYICLGEGRGICQSYIDVYM